MSVKFLVVELSKPIGVYTCLIDNVTDIKIKVGLSPVNEIKFHLQNDLAYLMKMSVGKISESEFEESLKNFVEISSKLLDDWKIIEDKVSFP